MQLANPENFKQFVKNKDSKTVTTSETVARVFGKLHAHVMRDIREILESGDDEFNRSNFGLVEYIDKKGEKRPMFEMTKDGFMLLVMGYKTKKAMAIKIAYIKAEKQLASVCGKALNEWKGKKPLLEATLKIFEDKLQIELPLPN